MTPEDQFKTTFVTRVDWEMAEQERCKQRAIDLSRESDLREILNEVRMDVKILIGWMNQQLALEPERLADFKQVKLLKSWVDGLKWIGGVVILLVSIIGYLVNNLILVPFFEYIKHLGGKS